MLRKTRLPLILLAVALALGSCAKDKKSGSTESAPGTATGKADQEAPAAKPAPTSAPAPRTLSEAKVTLTSSGQSRTIIMTPSGDIKADGEFFGTLGQDGNLRVAGETVLTLGDELITLERTGASSLVLASANDGSLRYRNEVVIGWNADGAMSGFMVKAMANENSTMSMSIEGPPEMRLPMSVALLAVMMSKGARQDIERGVFEQIDSDKMTPEMIKADLDAACAAAGDGKTLDEIANAVEYQTLPARRVFRIVADLEPAKRAEVMSAGAAEVGFPDWKCAPLTELLSAK